MSSDHFSMEPLRRMGLSSVESRTVQSSRAEIYYEVYGEGPAILMIPGAFDNILHWSLNIPYFVNAGYHVIAMNLRAHFMSRCHDVDSHFKHHIHDIAAVLDAQGVSRTAILASSFGGFGAIRFARAHRERTAALVLTGSTAGVYSPANYRNNRDTVAKFDPYFAMGAKPPATFDDTSKPMAFLFRQLSQLGGQDGFLSCPFQAVKSMDDESAWLKPEEMQDYATPTLIIGGDEDKLLPPGFQRETVTTIPGARLSDWTAAGHVPFWEDPDRYNKTVSAFLEENGWTA